MDHWYKATTEATVDGQTRVAAGFSKISPGDAKVRAETAARNAANRAARGEEGQDYPYGVRPLAEPVLREWRRGDGTLSGLLSVNARGCVVLNTAAVMFVDVDLPRPAKSSGGLFGSLFGRKSAVTAPDPAEPALAKLRAFVQAHPEWGFRVYRTAAGLRYLCTSALHDPAAPGSLAVLTELGSDPLYIRLCEKQECFRARLTPKPERVDRRAFKRLHRRPYGSKEEKPVALTDAAAPPASAYEIAAQKFGVCKYVEHLGATMTHPEVQLLAAIHDQYTRPDSGLPLA